MIFSSYLLCENFIISCSCGKLLIGIGFYGWGVGKGVFCLGFDMNER